MKTIHKYPVAAQRAQVIQMPLGATILSVQVQRDEVCLWALVDTSVVLSPRGIYVANTGEDLTELVAVRDVKFLGTMQLHDGRLVVHVFEDMGARG